MEDAANPEAPKQDPVPADGRIDELASQLLTVQQQVGQLELAANEKKKPWWLQTSLVISILSLTLSASLGLYTAYDQAHQRTVDAAKQRAAAMDATISDIVAIRMEDTKQAVALASTNIGAYRAWSSAAAVKRAMLIDSAMKEQAKLKGDLAPASALTLGNELIVDGRYKDAEELLLSGIKKAQDNGSSPAALRSTLAQVYLFPGSRLLDPKKGRELYHLAFESYPVGDDYNVLNSKLNLILYWAANEQGFENQAGAQELLKLADDVVKRCTLPKNAKAPLQALVDGVRMQLSPQNQGPNVLSPAKLLGKWQIVEPDSQSSDIVFSYNGGSPFPSFTKDRILSGKLVERVSGVGVILGQSQMRLDWIAAYYASPNGPFPMTGYTDAILGPDGAIRGTDFALGFPPRKWTARMSPVKR